MHRLTTPQQERLRHLVRRSPAFIGMRIEVHDDHVEVHHPESLTLGFASLSALVADAPAEQWPDVVDGYLERVLVLSTAEPPELTGPTEAVLERTYARLMEHPGPGVDLPSYVEEVVPGLLLVLAFDLPDAIVTLNDDHVRRHGLDRLHDAGLRNLCAELPDRYAEGDGVYVLRGSDYVGSLVLVLPWVIEAVTGTADAPDGALVAMPARDRLVFHVIRDRAGAERAMEELGRLAGEWYAESTHGLSPRVYWCPPPPLGGIETVGHHDGTELVAYYSNDFADMLRTVDRVWE